MHPTPLDIGRATAARLAPDHRDREDVAQEAAIAVAAVRAAQPEATTAYLRGVARHRALDILGGRPFTGHVGRGPVDPLRRAAAALDEDALPRALHATERGYEAVEWASLRPEIVDALEALPTTEKRVAHLVAFGGLSASDAGLRAGVSRVRGRKAWQAARARLRVSLSHLQELS